MQPVIMKRVAMLGEFSILIQCRFVSHELYWKRILFVNDAFDDANLRKTR
jgi:hypothetical protein